MYEYCLYGPGCQYWPDDTLRGNSREHNEGTTSTRNGEAAKGSVCNSLKSLKPYPEGANRRHCDGIYESSHTM